jgi:alkylglycerol monooxygenase
MSFDPIGAAVPFFLLLMGIEWWVSVRASRKVYRLNDAIADIGCGIGDQMLGVLAKAALLLGYVSVYEHFRFFELKDSPWIAWTIAILGVDFFYYWFHRFSHRTQFGWATHVVHHQSEEYNLAVALRQPWFSKFFSWMFYLPLALLGIPVELYVASFAVNLLYQFWIHTRLIETLGPLEWIFNTPSHHRVHHGINREYLDKNYAGIFIIWDRMFGTFEIEKEEPLYGTLAPIRSWNPFWLNIGPIIKLIKESWSQTLWPDKLSLWLRPPGWNAEEGRVVHVTQFPPPGRAYDADLNSGLTRYVFAQLIPITLGVSAILLVQGVWSETLVTVAIAFILFTLAVVAGLYEKRKWANAAEYLRLMLLISVGVLIWQMEKPSILWSTLVVGSGLCSLLAFAALTRKETKTVVVSHDL